MVSESSSNSGVFGNEGRDVIVGLGINDWDVSFSKRTQLREKMTLQFRAEFFNLFNSPFFEAQDQTTDVTNPDFGKIIQGYNPRNIQFGVRVIF